MKLICINNITNSTFKFYIGVVIFKELTIGKSYEVTSINCDKEILRFIGIINDNNKRALYPPECFAKIEDFREIQLNKILK